MSEAKCELCGEPMPAGEEMFKFHGYSYSGKCPKPPIEKVKREYWLVLDDEGDVMHAARYELACHEHINEAINEYKVDGAEKWIVREVALKD